MSKQLKLAGLVLAILVLVTACAKRTETVPGTTVGASEGWSPDISFSTVDADGTAWTDACFSQNKLTMLNLWAYWCGPCVGELPDLQKLSEDYADKGLQIVGVTADNDYDLSVAKMAELGVTYPCLVLAGDLAEALSTGYVPTTVFVDQDGKVLDEAYVGSRDYEAWAGIIEGYLS